MMSDVDASSPGGSAVSSSSGGLVVGINAVSRGLESDALSLVIVCRSVNPLALIAHLPVLCHLRQVPLITLHPQINSRMLAQALKRAKTDHTHAEADGTSSTDAATPASSSAGRHAKQGGAQVVMALAIPRSPHFAPMAAPLQPFSSVPSLPWLNPVPVVYQPVKVMHTDAPQRQAKQQQQQQQQKSKRPNTGGSAAGAAVQQGENVTATAPSAPSASTQAGAKHSAASATAGATGGSAGAAPKPRGESATQRRKKQKVEQQQQRAQTPPGQG